ncbi:hypothetical protein BDZ89DRAFT_1073437 [Hymenopellis radicata]|nr:hypothetical protein BDZ89DRAFT_1073437 [Hymenopellis radicata]
MPICTRHVDETTSQDVLFIVVLILGLLLASISIATAVLYCMKRSRKLHEMTEKQIIISLEVIEDNKGGGRLHESA